MAVLPLRLILLAFVPVAGQRTIIVCLSVQFPEPSVIE